MIRLETDAVLFDSDGVLIDSHRVVEQAWRLLCEEFELDAERLIGEQAGVRAQDTLGRYLTPPRTAQAVARLEDLEVELASQVSPFPGSLELIAQLGSFPWAIVTSASRRLAVSRWDAAGIDIPKATVTSEDVEFGKPHPEPYRRAAHALGVNPSRCVVFEDSPAGGAAAATLGATVVAVGDQSWPSEPKIRIEDLTQVSHRSAGLLTIDTQE